MSEELNLSGSQSPSLAQWAYTFAPFAIALTIGNLYAETWSNPTLGRIVYSIWISIAFAIPSLYLFGRYDLRSAKPGIYNYWRFCWVFAYLSYMIHFYYSVDVFFEWDITQISDSRRLGPIVAMINFILTLIWTIEIAVNVICPKFVKTNIFHAFQWAVHSLVAVAIFYPSAFTKSGVVTYLGWLAMSGLVFAVIVRLVTRAKGEQLS